MGVAVAFPRHSTDLRRCPVEFGVEERCRAQEPGSDATQTGHKVRSPPKEDAETEGAGQEADWQKEMMQHPGWLLIIVGLLIAGIGFVWLIAPSIPWLGNLPGDIAIEREDFRFYFPIVTCIVISVVLTGIMWLVRYLSR